MCSPVFGPDIGPTPRGRFRGGSHRKRARHALVSFPRRQRVRLRAAEVAPTTHTNFWPARKCRPSERTAGGPASPGDSDDLGAKIVGIANLTDSVASVQ